VVVFLAILSALKYSTLYSYSKDRKKVLYFLISIFFNWHCLSHFFENKYLRLKIVCYILEGIFYAVFSDKKKGNYMVLILGGKEIGFAKYLICYCSRFNRMH